MEAWSAHRTATSSNRWWCPLYVSSLANIGGCSGVIDVGDLSQFGIRPRHGTLLRDPDSGQVRETADGAPLAVGSCAATDSCSGYV